MKTMTLEGGEVHAADIIDGVPVDPVLPADFDDTRNEDRPESHQIWWELPFIVTQKGEGDAWLKAWPSGVRYDTRCLDGGAWDRSTFWGAFATVAEAVECAKLGPVWRRERKARA